MTDVSIEDIEKAITTLKELSPQFGELGWSVSTSNVTKYLEDELDRRKKSIRSVAVYETDYANAYCVYASLPDGNTLAVYISDVDDSRINVEKQSQILEGPPSRWGDEVWSNR